MKGLWARAHSVWKSLRHGAELDAAMRDEMRFHIEMEAERLARTRGLSPQEALRQAHLSFGGLEKFKEEGRDARGLRWLDAVSLDARLGVRMLIKHRGLTIVGAFAMAVTIAIGATFFESLRQMLNPALPLDEGDRVVALHYATPTSGSAERRVIVDFASWREELKSIEQLGAFRTVRHNLVLGDPPFDSIAVAEMSATGFSLAGTSPLRGRYLVPADEREDASPVIVIGHQAWQTRFGGDPNIVGRTLNVAGTATTIVGVMPDGFRFPLNHQYWMPLRANPLQFQRFQGPALYVFGRLRPGVTLVEAQAELTTLSQRESWSAPQGAEQLRLVVLPYTLEHTGVTDPARWWLVKLAQLVVGALTFVVAVNLAILIYARTVTRLGEIAVRTALGASRRRILVQLFIEALALSLVGAMLGLALSDVALDRLRAMLAANGIADYFWIDLELSAATIGYAFALAVLAALVMGVLPGIKATSRGVSSNLRELDVRSGTRLGGVWTTLVVAQVAVAVAVLPLAVYMAWGVVQMGLASPNFAAEQFVVGVVAPDDDRFAQDRGRMRAQQLALAARLEREPGVAAVTFSSGVPGFAPGRLVRFETPPGDEARVVKHPNVNLGIDSLDVAVDLFEIYDAKMLAGRAFQARDTASAAAVVNQAFVEQLLIVQSVGDALGVRFRYVSPYERPGTPAEASYEIIGVVRDFPDFPPEPWSEGTPTIYHAVGVGDLNPAVFSVRFTGTVPRDFVERFRVIGAEVDRRMQFQSVMPLADHYLQLRSFWRYLAWGVGLVTVSVLLLSAAGIYAMMSFTVARRQREIAIRTALGAAPPRLILNVFARATSQLGAGLVIGCVLSLAVFQNTDFTIAGAVAYTLTVAAIMIGVGLTAAAGPARRGLRVQASDALRADA